MSHVLRCWETKFSLPLWPNQNHPNTLYNTGRDVKLVKRVVVVTENVTVTNLVQIVKWKVTIYISQLISVDVECIYCTRKPYTRRKPRVTQKRKFETSTTLVPKESEPKRLKSLDEGVPQIYGTNITLYLNSIVKRFLEIHKHYMYPYHPLSLPDNVRGIL